MASIRTDLVRQAIERFPSLPNRAISRYILHTHGAIFDGDLEKIRDAVRYQRGAHGEEKRLKIGSKVLKRTGPVEMPLTWGRVRKPFRLSPGLWATLADIHAPFHEAKAIESAVCYCQKQKVTGLLFNGDLQDCAAVSFWTTVDRRNFDLEIESFLDFLDFIQSEFPKAEKVWKPGNHEYRLPRYYAAKAPELIGIPLAAFDVVLGLEHRGIEMLEYKQIVMAGKLPILHGDEYRMSTAVNPARGLFLKTNSWALCSHFHRTSEHSERNIQGQLLTTWSTGCLCNLSPDYQPSGNWNHGFALVAVEKDGNFEVENRRILPNGKVV